MSKSGSPFKNPTLRNWVTPLTTGTFNLAYRVIASGTVVPNTVGDRRGLFNRLFAALAPLRGKSRRLRDERRNVYKTLKFSLNANLVAILMTTLFAVFSLVETALFGIS